MATKFSCELDLNKFRLTDREKEVINKQGHLTIFETLLTYLVSAKYKEGVNGATLKTLNRIFKKLDSTENSIIELEEAELDFIKEAFFVWDIPVPPTQVRIFCAYKENLERAISG